MEWESLEIQMLVRLIVLGWTKRKNRNSRVFFSSSLLYFATIPRREYVHLFGVEFPSPVMSLLPAKERQYLHLKTKKGTRGKTSRVP